MPGPPVPGAEVVIAAPPDLPKATPANPVARLMPVLMVFVTVGVMVLFFTSGTASTRNPMYGIFPVMMLASMLGSAAYGARGGNRSAELDRDRSDYLRYIDCLSGAAAETADSQRRALAWTHPNPAALWCLVGHRRMWERSPPDSDFCHARVGLGIQTLATKLVAPELAPPAEADPVTTLAVRRLIRSRCVVADVPVAIALTSFSLVAVDGDRSAVLGLVRAIICQLAVLHSPRHLRILAVTDPVTATDWEWLKWLPHHQDPRRVDSAGPSRLTCDTAPAAAARCAGETGHVVVLLDSASDVGIEALCAMPEVTVLAVGGAMAESESVRLVIGPDGLVRRTETTGQVFARPDTLSADQALVCARRLARYRHVAEAEDPGTGSTPRSWPELMGIGDPARIDPATLWQVPRRRLRVPIGVSDEGGVLELDINEAARGGMGPHGLCVGATGSGKSEFLRTLTLGMIAGHSPDVLNLVLVDFKGGATFLGVESAPHVSAVITNLADEAALVARMKDALSGELMRRQELLRAAGQLASVADYQRARDAGAELPPLPALLIVVDEFSELLTQHPDFADLFVAIGRLGRSLGIHLLLSSQRVDEGRLRGLETHLSYRICLKTFSASESRAVLGVPDAYHLPGTPGAAYLKAATGELVRFQTAFVSASFRKTAVPGPQIMSTAAEPFTAAPVGPVRSVAPQTHSAAAPGTLLDTVVGQLAGHGNPACRIWLPPLAGSPPLSAVLTRTAGIALSVPIGLVDCPFEQRRDPLIAVLHGSQGHAVIVGGPQAGKSTAVRTLVLALAVTHGPGDVQVYCLDFGGGTLASLEPLPHVGSVAGRTDRELVRRTIAQLDSILRTRVARFRALGIDSIAEYRRLRSTNHPSVTDDPYGDVFLVIDGWGAVRQDFDDLEVMIIALAVQGLSYGVHLILTASRWAELRPALKDQIGTRIELRLGDPAESEMDRRRAQLIAGKSPGHGLTREGREFVIALPRLDTASATSGLAEAIAASGQALHIRHSGRTAAPIELLPQRVPQQSLIAATASGTESGLAIGLAEDDLRPARVDFGEHANLVILGDTECGKTSTLRTICREIVRTQTAESAQLMIIDFRRTMLGVVESEHLAGYAMSAGGVATALAPLLDLLRARMPGDTVTQRQIRDRSWWSGPEIYLVVDDYDLVAASAADPLTPLHDLLPHAKDLGLHVIVARRSGGAARAMFDPLLAVLRDTGCAGLMMSAAADEGVLFGSVRPTPLPPGRGTLITRTRPARLIQVAWIDPP